MSITITSVGLVLAFLNAVIEGESDARKVSREEAQCHLHRRMADYREVGPSDLDHILEEESEYSKPQFSFSGDKVVMEHKCYCFEGMVDQFGEETPQRISVPVAAVLAGAMNAR